MTDKQMVNISGLDKAAVLAVLFNASTPSGMGFLQAQHGPSVMTIEDAKKVIGNGGGEHGPLTGLGFDYLFGRPLKVNLTKDEFDPWGFDRDNGGPGTAQRLIEELRNNGQVNSDDLSDHRKELLKERSARVQEFVNDPTTVDGNTLHLGGDDVAGVVTHHHDQQAERFRQEW